MIHCPCVIKSRHGHVHVCSKLLYDPRVVAERKDWDSRTE